MKIHEAEQFLKKFKYNMMGKKIPPTPPKNSNPTQGKVKALQVPYVKQESCMHTPDPLPRSFRLLARISVQLFWHLCTCPESSQSCFSLLSLKRYFHFQHNIYISIPSTPSLNQVLIQILWWSAVRHSLVRLCTGTALPYGNIRAWQQWKVDPLPLLQGEARSLPSPCEKQLWYVWGESIALFGTVPKA